MLTGSASKGKYNYYDYYHCSSGCKVRFNAELMNQQFQKELTKYIPRPGRIQLYTAAIVNDFKSRSKLQDQERKNLYPSKYGVYRTDTENQLHEDFFRFVKLQ
jgi:site-specific DNA recombinase